MNPEKKRDQQMEQGSNRQSDDDRKQPSTGSASPGSSKSGDMSGSDTERPASTGGRNPGGHRDQKSR